MIFPITILYGLCRHKNRLIYKEKVNEIDILLNQFAEKKFPLNLYLFKNIEKFVFFFYFLAESQIVQLIQYLDRIS